MLIIIIFFNQRFLHFLCRGICDGLRNVLTVVACLIIKHMCSKAEKCVLPGRGNHVRGKGGWWENVEAASLIMPSRTTSAGFLGIYWPVFSGFLP